MTELLPRPAPPSLGDAGVGALDGVPLRLSPSGFLDARAYTSPGFFDVEMREVLPRSWCFAADTDALARPGDFVATRIGMEPVVVVRDGAGRIRAFSNVCPHRASLICEGSGNCGARLTCPYHGWTFHLDGRLANVTYRSLFDTPVVDDDLRLPELRTAVWERFVFVNVTGDAAPLAEWLGDAAEWFRFHRLSEGICRSRTSTEFPFNWKTFTDNGFDGYHTPFVHAETAERRIDTSGVQMWRGVNGTTSKSHYPWRGEYLARLPTVLDGLEGPWRVGSKVLAIHPHVLLAAMPDGSSFVMWTTPLALERTLVRINTYSPHEVDARAVPPSPEGRTVFDEDVDICLGVNAGMRSRFYRSGPQHRFELQAQHFQRWLMDAVVQVCAELETR